MDFKAGRGEGEGSDGVGGREYFSQASDNHPT